MPFTGLTSKVALVTGAARRRSIGRATALRLACEGCDVACLDIARPYADFPEYGLGSADELEELVREIRALDRRAVALRADVSSWDEVHRAVAEAHGMLGHIDICCNVAGGSGFGMGSAPLLQLTEREWDRVVDVNLKGTWIVSRACAERMVERGSGGRIVNVSSQGGKRGFPTMAAYCAAKAGVILLTQVLAIELAPTASPSTLCAPAPSTPIACRRTSPWSTSPPAWGPTSNHGSRARSRSAASRAPTTWRRPSPFSPATTPPTSPARRSTSAGGQTMV